MVTGTHRQPTSIKLKELFLSLQNQLQAKMVTSREFVHHPSAKGAASEQAWLAMLNAYLPQRYRADSAFVIDCEGELSDQIDIVIYDRQYSPLLFHQDGVLYVPAESVYAVFDVKQELGRWVILQAASKAASVRKLKRTSVPIHYAGGTYRPKRHLEIMAGVLSLQNRWVSEELGERLDVVLRQLPASQFLNLGCAVRCGAFEAVRKNKKTKIEKSKPETALIFFFLRLLHRLQQMGTVPALDIQKYAQHLS
jgi:hypothetical protein